MNETNRNLCQLIFSTHSIHLWHSFPPFGLQSGGPCLCMSAHNDIVWLKATTLLDLSQWLYQSSESCFSHRKLFHSEKNAIYFFTLLSSDVVFMCFSGFFFFNVSYTCYPFFLFSIRVSGIFRLISWMFSVFWKSSLVTMFLHPYFILRLACFILIWQLFFHLVSSWNHRWKPLFPYFHPFTFLCLCVCVIFFLFAPPLIILKMVLLESLLFNILFRSRVWLKHFNEVAVLYMYQAKVKQILRCCPFVACKQRVNLSNIKKWWERESKRAIFCPSANH